MKKTVDVWITMDKLGCITSPEVFLIELIARMRARESRGEIVVPATLTYEVPAKPVLPRCRDVDEWAQRKLAKAKKRMGGAK